MTYQASFPVGGINRTESATSGPSAGRLRGADVEVDARKAGSVALALILATLLVLGVVFAIAGARKNAQIQALRAHAVPIDVTVTSCVGLLGGSGSNFAGYSCMGAYTVAGKHFSELLPGSAARARGAVVHAVVVPSDPALISTAALVAKERASWTVFMLPAAFFATVLFVFALLGVVRHRSNLRRSPSREEERAHI